MKVIITNVGNLYKMLGFTKIKDTKPSYWYFQLGKDTRWHRYGFAKHTLLNKLKNMNGLKETNIFINT
jgi:hypothetical protein